MNSFDIGASCNSNWRRRFLQGAGAAIGLASLNPRSLFAQPSDRGTLRGTDFDLVIAPMPVNFTGAARIATAVNGQVPAPILCWNEGDTVTIRVTNQLQTVSSIHWHGILLPEEMDGVPGISFSGIAPGQTLHLPVQSAASRHILVSQPLSLPGADRIVRSDRCAPKKR